MTPAPDADGWIECSASDAARGESPVHADTMVEIRAVMPGETEARKLFQRRAWVSVWDNPAVIAYRIVEPRP